MVDESAPVERIPLEWDSGVARVLIRTANEGDRRLLDNWIETQDSYESVTTGVRTGEYDCCILDWATLLDDRDALRARKREERIPLPALLLVPEQRADDIIESLRIDSHELHSLVDELLRMPLSYLELEQRLESVLRARTQAVRLHEEHQQLHAIRDQHPGHGIVITDTEGTIEYVNSGFERQSGYSAEEVLGENPNVLNSGVHDDSFFEDLWETVLSGEQWSGEVINERKDGGRYIVDQTITPLTGPDGEIEQLVAVNHEVTELRELANSLSAQREQLELLNRVLRHDIRNDMTVILGWLEALDSHVDDEGEKILDEVLAAGRHVVELTDSAKTIVEGIIEGKEPSLEPVELGRVLEHVIETRRETFDEATITKQGSLPAITVNANEMLAAVFRNLINNAVQHNDRDEPTVSISWTEGDDTVQIRVADNGPGVSEKQRNRIFDSDEKGLESDWTGMGLYLVKNLVEMYDGSIRVEDNEP
ncbi:MAG: two-component system sensor histidine kinase NtrB, partial [archaeon]